MASKLYPISPILLVLLINNNASAVPSYQKLGKVMRLSFEGIQELTLKAERSQSQGGNCKGSATDDLVLNFRQTPAWMNQFDPNQFEKQGEENPCEVKGRPLDGGEGFELRFSYPAQKGRHVEAITYSSAAATYVDHWFSFENNLKTKLTVSTKKPGKNSIVSKNISEFFESSVSWQKVSGTSKDSSDLNSPGLDKFRDYKVETNAGILNEPVERLPLKLPIMDLPLVTFSIDFEEKKLPVDKFDAEDLTEFKSLPETRKKMLLDSLNLILVFIKKGEFNRAYETIQILEKSNLKKFIPNHRASWWALKGYVSLKYSETTFANSKDAPGLLLQKTLDTWREGIRRFSGQGGINQEYAEYMIVELVRNLLNRKLPFAALSSMIWAQKYSWSAVTEERFEYLKAVALENLSIFGEAETAFKAFFASRSSVSASVIHDRRLVPASALWPGDMALKEKRYQKVIDEYGDALNKIPSPRKFSFEKTWYPDFVRQFPEVLINRAEAYMRLGQLSNSLRDLRAFIFVAPNHAFASVAYFRIGDLLEQLGGDAEKAQGAWRECVFRFREQLAGPLCQSRLSYHRLIDKEATKAEWPRLIADVEDAQKSIRLLPKYSFNPDDVRIFLSLLLADAFLKTDQPLQALLRLDPIDNINPSTYIGLWYREYRIVSLQGVLQRRLHEGKPRSVISEYEKRRKTLFLFQTRGEILLSLSQAFSAMGLWEEARKTLDQAWRVKNALNRPINRVYDQPEEEWKIHEANVNVHLMASAKVSEKDTQKSLLSAAENSEIVQRAWILYYQNKKDPSSESEWWKKLENKTSLTSEEIRDYAKALEFTKQTAALKDLLERRVGVTLTESEVPKIDKNFSSELLLKLAELRRSSKEYDRALTALNFLLTLDANQLHVRTPRVLVMYQKAMVFKDLKRLEEALRVFQEAQLLAPDTIWGKLSKSNALEIDASLKRQSENR